MAARTTIISVGDELVWGQQVDTNSAWLAERLTAMGWQVVGHMTLGDNQQALADALAYGASGSDLIVVSGGLGPTADDLTRFALADWLGCELQTDEIALNQIKALFERMGYQMNQANEVQALIPVQAQAIPNLCGTAPGLRACNEGVTCFCMPGVPAEMKEMFERTVAVELGAMDRCAVGHQIQVTRLLQTMGLGESRLGEALADLMRRGANPTVNTTAKNAVVTVRINARADNNAAAQKLIEASEQEIRRRIGQYIFGVNDDSFAQAVVKALRERSLTVAVAESCTGGSLGQALTDVPGASDIFRGGWIVYSNKMKTALLDVDPKVLALEGAVSEPVAEQLARQARKLAEADLAVAITGVAGPSGGSDEKPVGTVWFGLADQDGVMTRRRHFIGDRHRVRSRSVNEALRLIYERVRERN